MQKENIMGVLIAFYLYVETTETSSFHYTSSNHTAYRVCCIYWLWRHITQYFAVHELNVIWNNAFRCIFNCCWRESVKPLQFYCNTVPMSYRIDERKLLFYCNTSRSKNVMLKILMCLTGVLSDYMFLCSKYGVSCASSKNDI